MEKMRLSEGAKVLDVGGQPEIWDAIEVPLKITCLNLPGVVNDRHRSHHDIEYVVGDGCSMPQYSRGQFDFVFSNSVIEHVGSPDKRRMFAEEVRRISDNYWIQTPCKYFPIEAHCGMPFWWFYPEALRSYFITRWKQKLPAWTEMVEETDVVSKEEMSALFPEAKIKTEWLLFPKSLMAYSLADHRH